VFQLAFQVVRLEIRQTKRNRVADRETSSADPYEPGDTEPHSSADGQSAAYFSDGHLDGNVHEPSSSSSYSSARRRRCVSASGVVFALPAADAPTPPRRLLSEARDAA